MYKQDKSPPAFLSLTGAHDDERARYSAGNPTKVFLGGGNEMGKGKNCLDLLE